MGSGDARRVRINLNDIGGLAALINGLGPRDHIPVPGNALTDLIGMLPRVAISFGRRRG